VVVLNKKAPYESDGVANTGQANDQPLITIGIPFFNPGRAFSDAIRSVFAQSYSNWELILVDDGSTDGSLELALRIRDPRVKVISDGLSLGLAARLNQINQMAKGEYIARMDADDIMHPDRIAAQIKYMLAHPYVDVVGTGVFFLDHENRVVGIRLTDRVPESLLDALRKPWLVHGTIMAKRQWFLKNPYNPKFLRGEERELFLRTFTFTRFGLIKKLLYGWRFKSTHTLRKYLSSFHYERQALLQHGPKLLGWPITLSLLLRSFAKVLITTSLFEIGGKELIYRHAFAPVPDSTRKMLEDVIKYVCSYPVPGW